jgi:hypothetical protein
MRKLLIFAATAMLLGGLYFLAAELFLVHRMFFRIIIAASMLTATGSYLLWAEFIAPLFGIANGEK